MKLLLKLLGISDYIEDLEYLANTSNKLELENKELKATNSSLRNELENRFKELNDLLSTKTKLTAEVLKLKEQLQYKDNTIDLLEIKTIELERELQESKDKVDNLKHYMLDKLNQLAKDLHSYD